MRFHNKNCGLWNTRGIYALQYFNSGKNLGSFHVFQIGHSFRWSILLSRVAKDAARQRGGPLKSRSLFMTLIVPKCWCFCSGNKQQQSDASRIPQHFLQKKNLKNTRAAAFKNPVRNTGPFLGKFLQRRHSWWWLALLNIYDALKQLSFGKICKMKRIVNQNEKQKKISPAVCVCAILNADKLFERETLIRLC